ncbi:unnamed protein product, partial [Laminaria digitata]
MRRKSPPPSGYLTPPSMVPGEGGSAPKPNSGRSWKAPQFVIDSEKHTPSTLLEDTPAHGKGSPLMSSSLSPSVPEMGGGSVGDGLTPVGKGLKPSPSQGSGRERMPRLGYSPPRHSVGSSSRRSSSSAFSRGTASTRRGNTRTSGGGGGSGSSSGGSSSSRVSGGGASGGSSGDGSGGAGGGSG